MNTDTRPASVLTTKQVKTYGPRIYTDHGETYKMLVKVRYDDECGNGHNTFAITCDIYRKGKNGHWYDDGGGEAHEEIVKRFPELAPYVKWHLCSSDGPMHYVANTVYHAEEHGPQYAWVYYTGPSDPLGIEEEKERLLGYVKPAKAKEAEGQPGYRVVWDKKTIKTRNLDYARSSAIWPEATDAELCVPKVKLTAMLEARLPKLMEEFKQAVESLGFTY